jgi:oligoendopeptidase F
MNWNLTSYFPEFNGPEMMEFKESLKRDIQNTKERAASLAPIDDGNMKEWEEVFLGNEDLVSRYSHLSSYIGCLSSADGLNEEYLREEAEMSMMGAEFSKLKVELMRAVKEASGNVFETFSEREAMTSCKYYLGRLRQESQKRMNSEKEILAADLGVDGISAWGRLYDTISSKLEFEMKYPDGTVKKLPISQRRSLMEKPERSIRKAAFEGGNRAWQSIEDTAAAALNAIAGTRLTLNRQRGIDHFLDVALFQSSISRKTLDAMFEAIYSELELPRSILRLKAGTMNRKCIAWYDLGAPLDLSQEDGQEVVLRVVSPSRQVRGRCIQKGVDRLGTARG